MLSLPSGVCRCAKKAALIAITPSIPAAFLTSNYALSFAARERLRSSFDGVSVGSGPRLKGLLPAPEGACGTPL